MPLKNHTLIFRTERHVASYTSYNTSRVTCLQSQHEHATTMQQRCHSSKQQQQQATAAASYSSKQQQQQQATAAASNSSSKQQQQQATAAASNRSSEIRAIQHCPLLTSTCAVQRVLPSEFGSEHCFNVLVEKIEGGWC